MPNITLQSLNDFNEWRLAARELLRAGIAPEDVVWRDPLAAPELFASPGLDLVSSIESRPAGSVPGAFVDLAPDVLCHSDPERFGLLYRLLWRLQADRSLLAVASDLDVAASSICATPCTATATR